MKKNTFLFILFTACFLLNFNTYSQTFDWETATDVGATVTHTVSGITATVSSSNNAINLVDAGNINGTSGKVVFTANNNDNTNATISFSTSVNIATINAFDSQLSGSSTWTFTPVGGSDSAVTASVTGTVATVVLNWTGITGIVVTSSDGNDSFGFDDIVLGAGTAAPTVITNSATPIAFSSATLYGSVTADGGDAITERGFIYALTSNDATPTVAEAGGGSVEKIVVTGTTGSFNEEITSLTASSEYSYAAYAINSTGTTQGVTQTFTTITNTDNCIVTNPYDANNNNSGDLNYGQSFVACKTGTLSFISLLVTFNQGSTGETINIYSGSTISPENLLGSATGQELTHNGGDANNVYITDFSGEYIQLTAGQTYTFDIPTTAHLVYTTDNGYPDGDIYVNGTPNGGNLDLIFNVEILPTVIGWTGTTDNDWATTTNWSSGALPLATDDVVIPNVANKPIITSGTIAVADDITVDASSSLTINAGGSLTIGGNLTQNGTFTVNSDTTTNGSLIVKGTATGNVSYNRYLTSSAVATDGWHLVSAPLNGQSINTFSGSLLTSGTNNKSVAIYDNSVVSASRWSYYSTATITSAGNFLTAKGYSIKKATAGTLDFTGTINTNPSETISITDGGDDPNGNRWNLIGNPYTAALYGNNTADATNNFLKVNIDAGNLDPTRAGVYLWNGSKPYDIKSLDDAAFYIAPGQGLFVHAPDGGGTSISFTEAMQTHQTGDIFLKSSTNYPEIILNVSDNIQNTFTKIRYIENKTTGLDIGSDVGTFNGDGTTNFSVYSHLVSDSEGVNFAIQALPNSDYENMVVPLGINAEIGKEITFSLNASNFSSDLKIFLEDRASNTITRLDEANSNYKITLSENLNGIGRFYLHTKTSTALSIDENLLENISIYKLDNTTLRIAGLSAENISIKLFTVLGKQVMSSSFKSNRVADISIPKLASGVYIVQLKSDFGKLNKKIIIE